MTENVRIGFKIKNPTNVYAQCSTFDDYREVKLDKYDPINWSARQQVFAQLRYEHNHGCIL